jgi:hypothetical protein
MESSEVQLRGLAWVQKAFNLEPQWTVEPNTEAIERTIQTLRPSSTIQVTFLAEGALNKIYEVKIDNEVFVMRISLSVDPYYKTMSEVATLGWISRIADTPVPRVITYQSSRENLIGFEWILITKMSGKPLREVSRSLSFSANSNLVGEFAAYSSCLFRNQFQGIGNIYSAASALGDVPLAEATLPDGDSACSTKSPLPELSRGSPQVDRNVSMHFFWGSHILQNVHRGQYDSSRD